MKSEIQLVVEQPLLDLMKFCETFCVAGCCGVDAFDNSKEAVGCWISTQREDQVHLATTQLHTLIKEIENQSLNITSDWIEAHWSPEACAAWLKEWETALDEASKK